MEATSKAYTPVSFLFFIPLVFIGAFFLLNLTLAVIKAKFSEEHNRKKEQDLEEQERTSKKKNIKLLEEVQYDELDED